MTIPTVQFKAKPYKVRQSDDPADFRMVIDFKRQFSRADCNLRPHEHTYYNSDLFTGLLNRAVKDLVGPYKTWFYVDDPPAGVTVDTSKFLAVVTITLPQSFMR